MAAVSETIVREFFELRGFLVCQQRKYTPLGRGADEEIGFFVSNPRPCDAGVPLPSLITPEDLPRIARAVVVVKGWHTETFAPSAVAAHAPEIFRFLEPKSLKQSAQFFGEGQEVVKILVVPALPRALESREATIRLLREKGVDAVIAFHTILRDLIDNVATNRNYRKSDLLQILRILKNYDLLRETQLELFKGGRRTRKADGPERAAGL
jgi:hypothetical protein